MELSSRNRLISLPHVRRCRDTVMPFFKPPQIYCRSGFESVDSHYLAGSLYRYFELRFVAFALFFWSSHEGMTTWPSFRSLSESRMREAP